MVLVDFGVAREAVRDGGDPGDRDARYMAPEVLVGEEVSPRSDVYGLAATVWALLAGTPPVLRRPRRPWRRSSHGVRPSWSARCARRWRSGPSAGSRRRRRSPRASGSRSRAREGRSLAAQRRGADGGARLLEAIVRTTAGVFEAAAASIALIDAATGELVYQAAWGAGADEIGRRAAAARRRDSPGSVVARREAVAIPDCRSDARFARDVAREDRLRAPHDARGAARARRRGDRRALDPRPPRRRGLRPGRSGAGRACSPSSRSRDRRRRTAPLSCARRRAQEQRGRADEQHEEAELDGERRSRGAGRRSSVPNAVDLARTPRRREPRVHVDGGARRRPAPTARRSRRRGRRGPAPPCAPAARSRRRTGAAGSPPAGSGSSPGRGVDTRAETSSPIPTATNPVATSRPRHRGVGAERSASSGRKASRTPA